MVVQYTLYRLIDITIKCKICTYVNSYNVQLWLGMIKSASCAEELPIIYNFIQPAIATVLLYLYSSTEKYRTKLK